MDFSKIKYRNSCTKEVDYDELIRVNNNMTPEQRREAKISMIYGFMDSDMDVTKDQIREELERVWGWIKD